MKPQFTAILIISFIILCSTGMSYSLTDTVDQNNNQSMNKGQIWHVGGGLLNLRTIQRAILVARRGDTILVHARPRAYFQKALIWKSVNIVGEDKNTTFIDGLGSTIFFVIAPNVRISGFTLRYYSVGRFMFGGIIILSNNVTIENNIMRNEDSLGHVGKGINVWINSRDNIIRNNFIGYSYDGISMWRSDNNIVEGNNLTDLEFGIRVRNSDNTIIKNNTLHSAQISIFIQDNSSYTSIQGNDIFGGKGAEPGIAIGEGWYNEVFENTITNMETGIDLHNSKGPSYAQFNRIYHNNL
ncbi:MAG: right-handed parallel beta-helix repeat-containing protein, partial [Candidatus Thermoplasmatota archaeon]|nr:right-handed parallel beta-helix repeat-containing protein [Candidatus Thermoplasmatota archaeon]